MRHTTEERFYARWDVNVSNAHVNTRTTQREEFLTGPDTTGMATARVAAHNNNSPVASAAIVGDST